MSHFFSTKYLFKIIFPIFVLSLLLALVQVYIRVQTTLVGYELGELKKQEAELLEKRAGLQMHYAKLTTKEALLKNIPKNEFEYENDQ